MATGKMLSGQGPVVDRSPRMMMMRSRESIALDEARADPRWSIESAPCLDLELDLPDEDDSRVRS